MILLACVAYPIVRVAADASEQSETVGTKDKFWYEGRGKLFKLVHGAGEDWAEKVCAEVARTLGLPHAEYDLAIWDAGDKLGVASSNFCIPNGELILGNELLSEVYPDYETPGVSRFRQSAHTVGRVLDVLKKYEPATPLGWAAPAWAGDALGTFVGYLLLDALVGNTDRHHENWGFVRTRDGLLRLAPTFDHASSLGCHILDSERGARLKSKDKNYDVAAYAAKARSALYADEHDGKPLKTLDAFVSVAQRAPVAGRGWIQRLEDVPFGDLAILIDNVPRERITEPSAEFAQQVMAANLQRIITARGTLP